MAYAALLQNHSSPYFEELVEHTKKKPVGLSQRLAQMELQRKRFDESSCPSEGAWTDLLRDCQAFVERFKRRQGQTKQSKVSGPMPGSPLKGEAVDRQQEKERLEFLKGVSSQLSSSDYSNKFKALVQLEKYRVTKEEAQKYKFGRLVQEIYKQERPPSQSVAQQLMSAWKEEEGASKKRKLAEAEDHLFVADS